MAETCLERAIASDPIADAKDLILGLMDRLNTATVDFEAERGQIAQQLQRLRQDVDRLKGQALREALQSA